MINFRPIDLSEVEHLPALYQGNLSRVYAYVLEKDNQLISMFGYIEIHKFMAEVFVKHFSDDYGKYKKSLIKNCKQIVEDMSKNYRRINATVLKDFKDGCSFVEFFGFSLESEILLFDEEGKDYFRYSKLNRSL